MSETTEVATQPAGTPQTSVGGGNNVTAASVAAMFLKGSKPQETETATESNADAPDTPEAGLPESQQEEPQDQQVEAEQSEEQPQGEEAQGEPEESEVDTQSSLADKKLSPELQKILDKRIGKEVAKRKALEEELARVKSETQAPKQSQPEPEPVSTASADTPLADVNDFKGLEKAHEDALEVKDWARKLLDRDDIGEGVQFGNQVYSKADLKTILYNAERTLERDIPKRQRFLQQRFQAEQAAVTEFSWMKDKSSNEYAQYQHILKIRPYVKHDPDAPYIVGLAIEGLKAIEARKAAAQKPAAPAIKPKPPASQTAPSGAAAKPAKVDAAVARETAEKKKQILSKGNLNVSDVTSLLRKKL